MITIGNKLNNVSFVFIVYCVNEKENYNDNNKCYIEQIIYTFKHYDFFLEIPLIIYSFTLLIFVEIH